MIIFKQEADSHFCPLPAFFYRDERHSEQVFRFVNEGDVFLRDASHKRNKCAKAQAKEVTVAAPLAYKASNSMCYS